MRVFLIAGEPSGDALGGAFMAGLKTLRPDVTFDGVGGPEMAAHGLSSRFPMAELSVMGLWEVLPRYFALKRRIAELAEAVIETRPDLLLTIDSPDFCLRVARLVKARSTVRTVHYVAPTVWAWRPERAGKMAEVIDHVLALFPFEPPYMEAAGMECDFVGHPVVAQPQASPAEAEAFRIRFGLQDAAPLLLVLPGSRRGEVSRLAPVYGAALGELARDHPGLRAVLPAAAPVADLVREQVARWPVAPVVIDPADDPDGADKRAAFRAAEVALATSGTVALELAAAVTPMISAYDMHWLTRQIVTRKLLLDTANLVNIVSETRVVPEFLGADCRPDRIASGLARLIAAPEDQAAAMALTMQRLGAGGEDPGLRAARAVLSRLRNGREAPGQPSVTRA